MFSFDLGFLCDILTIQFISGLIFGIFVGGLFCQYRVRIDTTKEIEKLKKEINVLDNDIEILNNQFLKTLHNNIKGS